MNSSTKIVILYPIPSERCPLNGLFQIFETGSKVLLSFETEENEPIDFDQHKLHETWMTMTY